MSQKRGGIVRPSIDKVYRYPVACSGFRALWVALLSLGLFSCDGVIVESHRLPLTVEALPTRWREIFGAQLHYYLNWYDARGRQQRAQIADIQTLPEVEVALLSQTPIYVVPRTPQGHELSPAGAVFPLALNNKGELILRWREGCAVRHLHSLFPEMQGLVTFNVGRYLDEMERRLAEYSCWIDEERLSALLRIQRMRANAIRISPLYSHSVELPAGRWRTVDLALEELLIHQRGGLILPPLPEGIHYLYEIAAGLQATISIEEDRSLLLLTRYE